MAQLIAGTETGLIRVIDASSGNTRLASTSNGQDRSRGVLCLTWGNDRKFYCARRNGDIETWEEVTTSSNLEDDSWELTQCRRVGEAREYTALFRLHDDGKSPEDAVLSCSDDGRIEMWKESVISMRLDVQGQVSATDLIKNHLIVGGREHELSLWNLESGDREWRARNVPNNHLDLRRPVWPAATRFRTANTLALGTKYREIRLYDIRAQRRPIAEADNISEHAIRELILLNEDTALFGDVAGDIFAFDFKKMRIIARYPGPAGSVRALAHHPSPKLSNDLFAAASLDRHVYLWDARRRDKLPISSVYCKQRLSALLWIPDDSPFSNVSSNKDVLSSDDVNLDIDESDQDDSESEREDDDDSADNDDDSEKIHDL